MLLEFYVYQIKKNTKSYTNLIEKYKLPNEFIVVGEDEITENFFKTQPIFDDGLRLICDSLNEGAMLINKNDMELKRTDDCLGACEYQEFDIPKEYLTVDIIDTIKRLNDN